MQWRKRWRGVFAQFLLSGLCLLAMAAPAWACQDRSSVWEWERCWFSVPRLFLFAAAASGWWFLCFHRLFPVFLAPTRNDAPLPRLAFRRCLALWAALMVFTLVVLYAVLSDEMRGGGRTSGSWLSRNWSWLLALVIGSGIALAIWAPGRKPKPAPGAQPAPSGEEGA